MIVYVYNTLFSKKQIIPATGHSTDDLLLVKVYTIDNAVDMTVDYV